MTSFQQYEIDYHEGHGRHRLVEQPCGTELVPASRWMHDCTADDERRRSEVEYRRQHGDL